MPQVTPPPPPKAVSAPAPMPIPAPPAVSPPPPVLERAAPPTLPGVPAVPHPQPAQRRTDAVDLITQAAVSDEDVRAEYRLCVPMPPPTLSADVYAEGMDVVVIKPSMRTTDITLLKRCEDPAAFSWLPPHPPVEVGTPARVARVVQLPGSPVAYHLLRLRRAGSNKQNAMLIPAAALGPANWRGQFVTIDDPTMRRDDSAEALKEFAPCVPPDQRAGNDDVRRKRTARVIACLRGSDKPRGEVVCILRLEPTRGSSPPLYCVYPTAALSDAAHALKAQRPRLKLAGPDGKSVADFSSTEPVQATYTGATGFRVTRPLRGQMLAHTYQLHVLKYAPTARVAQLARTAYGMAVEPPRKMARIDLRSADAPAAMPPHI